MLNINVIGLLYTVVNLLVLYVLLKKFLWTPVTAMIESRQKEMEDNLTGAEARNREAEARLDSYNEKLVHARQECAQMVAQAKEQGTQEYNAILDQARADAEKLKGQAEQQMKQERAEMISGLRREVSSLALLCAAKVAGKELGTDADRAMVEEFLSEVGEGT